MHMTEDAINGAFAVMLLQGDAAVWFNTLGHNPLTVGWRWLKSHLRTEFMPADSLMKARDELAALSQGNMSVSEYVHTFRHLILRVTDANHAEKKDRFIRGLRSNVKSYVMANHKPSMTLDGLI